MGFLERFTFWVKYGEKNMKRIKAKKTPWTQHIGATFTWPEDVEVVFPDGEVHDAYGARDRNGNSIDYNPSGRGSTGSPCHQALVAHGLIE